MTATPIAIAVQIDSCAWNWLFDKRVNLGEAFPREKYALFMTREVEIELSTIPDLGKDGKDKRLLKIYIENSIKAHNIHTTYVFGFAEAGINVYGGFGVGTWQSDQDRSWYERQKVKQLLLGKPPRNEALTGNQADASLSVRSFDSIVLTVDSKKGPLQLAFQQGGKIIFLPDVERSGLSLKEYVEKNFT